MKTHNHLFQQIYSFENLFNASRKAQRGKRFQDEVARFNFHLERELYRSQQEQSNEHEQRVSLCEGPFRKDYYLFELPELVCLRCR